MRVTFRSQQKVRRIFIPRNTLVGAIAGVTPALIVMPKESEANKMEYVIAFAVVAMMGCMS
jgi:gas vesicle protein